MGRFQDQVVWITGGGSGIGRALALEFAQQGADVAISGRRRDRLDEVVAEVEALGRRGLAVPLDVTDDEACAAAVAEVVTGLGKLDVAVANAGMGVMGRIEKLTDAEWRRQFDVNVFGAVNTIRQALPALRDTRGRMVLICSVAGLLCGPSAGAYSASKFAVRAIGLTLSAELHGSGVSCTTVHPGFVSSEINKVDNSGVFHEDRVDKRPQRFLWPADKAARVIVRAVHRRKREFVFTWHGKFGGWLGQHMPGLTHALLTRVGGKKTKSMADNKA